MQKITPHLWFDTEAVEAAYFYASTFPDSTVTNVTTIHDTPSGDTDIVSFELLGQPFMAISAGPLFKFHPCGLVHRLLPGPGGGGHAVGAAVRWWDGADAPRVLPVQ